ncbi:MAG TPA: hypothetical protein VMW58_02445 [Anaerolineae bacterium]|nr:hypothetical protein [Anaerolineae bacterium]
MIISPSRPVSLLLHSAQEAILLLADRPSGRHFALLGVAVLVSQFLANAGTAALMPPIAMGIEPHCGGEYRASLLGLCVTSSVAVMTPVSHPGCMLVMAPGGYRFSDFAKVGPPLCWIQYRQDLFQASLRH